MRSRVIPFGIAFADGQNASVTHVDGNENLFTFMCGDGPFSENHLIDIDVVVDGMESFAGLQACSFQQGFGNLLPVQSGKLLAKSYIMQILLQVFAGNKAKVFRYLFLRCSDFACWMAC